ncbi:MAG: FAD-dependent oxidoreductase [Verrucomicrobiota bacterium]
MSESSISTLVIGAGLTGLSCSIHLKREHLIVEAEHEPGGIVRTRIKHDGFYCDGTGHWLHLRNADMKAMVYEALGDNIVEYTRQARIFSKNVHTLFPFQANLAGLPADVILECLTGLWKARHPGDFNAEADTAPSTSFGESVLRLFGEGISKHFMTPYNEKLLGVPLTEISPRYAERFVPKPSIEDILNGAFGRSKESLGYNATFIYPRTGGIGALPKALADHFGVEPEYGVRVTAIDLETRTAELSDGRTIHYENLVNTMPLANLLKLLRKTPPGIAEESAKLRATTVYYFDVGVRGPGAKGSDFHWVYFPEPEFVFYRVGSYSAVHPELAPMGCRSYYVEISGGYEEYRRDLEGLKQRVVRDLIRGGTLSADDEILFMDLCEIPYAYVVFDSCYEASRAIILEELAKHGVQSCGRWGGWNYGGMEDALLEGRAAAIRINDAAIDHSGKLRRDPGVS